MSSDRIRDLDEAVSRDRQWGLSGREPSFLLAGSRLEQVEAWGSGTSLALGLEERMYLTASITRREEERAKEEVRRDRERLLERRSVKRMRIVVAVLAVAALVAASLTLVAKDQSSRAERESRIATARELAAASMASLEEDAERSVLLAIQAVETTRDVDGTVVPEAEEALHRAVQADRIILSLKAGGVVRYSPDGSRLFMPGLEPGTAQFFDAETGEVLMTLRGQGDDGLSNLSYSPDGRFVSTSSRSDASTDVWDAETGELLHRFTLRSGEPVCCWSEFAPDGSLLATMAFDGSTRLWDLSTFEQVDKIHRLCALGFSPDGRELWIDRCAYDVLLPIGLKRAFCVDGQGEGITDVSWSSDGSRVATASDDGSVSLWGADTGNQELTISVGIWSTTLSCHRTGSGSRSAWETAR